MVINLLGKRLFADALRELGGEAHLSDINQKIKGHPKTKTNPTWKDTIRRVVRQYSIFVPVPPERSGLYRLVEIETPLLKNQNLDLPDAEMNHDMAQGMLVTLGKLYGYETFVPTHDQTVRKFQGKKLGEIVTVKDCTPVFQGPNLYKAREIDVIWFGEDDYGIYPIYAFEVEHKTKVKDGLDRLLKIPHRFNTSLFVVGSDGEKLTLFERYIQQTPFRNFRTKFTFRMYGELENVYNASINHVTERDKFGIVERNRRL